MAARRRRRAPGGRARDVLARRSSRAPPAEQWPFLHPLVPPLPPGRWWSCADARRSAFETAADRRHAAGDDAGAATCSPSGCARSTAHGEATLVATANHAARPPPCPKTPAAARRLRAGGRRRSDPDGVPATDAPPERSPSRCRARSARAFREADPGRAAADLRRARWTTGAAAAALVATASVCRRSTTSRARRAIWTRRSRWRPSGPPRTSSAASCGCALDDMERGGASFPSAPPSCCRVSAPRGRILAPRSASWIARPRRCAAFERRWPSIRRAPRPSTTSASSGASSAGWRESEAAFRQVIELEPNWPLAITIWGIHCFCRDVTRRRCRLCRGPGARPGAEPGAGDAAGAVPAGDRRCRRRAARAAAGDRGRCRGTTGSSCSADTSAMLWALVTQQARSCAGWQGVHEWLTRANWRSSHDRRRMSGGTRPQSVRARFARTIAASASPPAWRSSSPFRWRCCSTSSSGR